MNRILTREENLAKWLSKASDYWWPKTGNVAFISSYRLRFLKRMLREVDASHADLITKIADMAERWKKSRAHTYSSENADHYRGFDAGLFRCAEEVQRLFAAKPKRKK